MGSDDYSMTSCSECKANKTELFDNTELDSVKNLTELEKMASDAESLVSSSEGMESSDIDSSDSEGLSEDMSYSEGSKKLDENSYKLIKKVDSEYRKNLKMIEGYDVNWCRARNRYLIYIRNYTRYIRNTKNWMAKYKYHYNKYKKTNNWWKNTFPGRLNRIAIWTMYRKMYQDLYKILAVACEGGGNEACKQAKVEKYYYKLYYRYYRNYLRYYNRYRRSGSSYWRRMARRYKNYSDSYFLHYKTRLERYKKATKKCIPETNKTCKIARKKSLAAQKQRYNERRYKAYSDYHAQYAKYYTEYKKRNPRNGWWRRHGNRVINNQKNYSRARLRSSKYYGKIADRLERQALPYTKRCGEAESVRFLKKYANVIRQLRQAKIAKDDEVAEILKKKADLILDQYARAKGQSLGKTGNALKKYMKQVIKSPPHVSSSSGGSSMFLIFVIIVLLAVIGAGAFFCFSMKPADVVNAISTQVEEATMGAPAIAEE